MTHLAAPTPVANPYGVIVVDQQGRVAYCDERLARCAVGELIGTSLSDGRLVNQTHVEILERAIATAGRERRAVDFKLVGRLAGMRQRQMSARAVPLVEVVSAEDDSPTIKWVAIELVDSELVDAQDAKLLAVDRLAAMGVLAAGVVHDLSNPLYSLRSTVDSLREEGSVAAEAVSQMQDALNRCERGLMAMRVFARQIRATKSAVDLDQLLHVCSWLVGRSLRGIDFEIDGDELPLVSVDRATLGQLVVGLMTSAAEATLSNKGTEVQISTWCDDNGVEINITDGGGPIDPSELQSLFDPSSSAAHPRRGPGMGLPMCSFLAHRLGLRLSARPSGEGVSLSLRLPPAVVA